MKSLIRAVSIGSKALLEFSTCERTEISFPVQLQVMSSWAGPHMQKERHMHFTESQKMTKQLLLNNKYHICNRLPFLSFPPELQDQIRQSSALGNKYCCTYKYSTALELESTRDCVEKQLCDMKGQHRIKLPCRECDM